MSTTATAVLARDVLAEARLVLKNPKLQRGMLIEWSEDEAALRDGVRKQKEVLVFLPLVAVSLVVLQCNDRRKA